MSRILWQEALTPPAEAVTKDYDYSLYDCGFQVAATRSFSQNDEEIVELPDPRAYRSMSRAGILLAAVGLKSKATLSPFLNNNLYSVGIYCAIENGPTDYGCAKRMVQTTPEHFATTYKKLRSAKQYLRQLPNLAPAQLGIFLDIRGPMNVYNHSTMGCIQALEQAEFDLHTGVVQAALVGSAFSLEDALLAMRCRRQVEHTTILAEGAGCLVLGRDDSFTDWRRAHTDESGLSYGIASKIVHIAHQGALT